MCVGRLVLLLLACEVASGPRAAVGAEAAGRVAWGDWVVAADDAEPGASILLRRITPKSVFVAPTFTGCSEGYRQDSLGRCVKLVKVNQQSQWNFFLERLNSMYAPSSTSKNPQKETGPFHINLPIASEDPQEDIVIKKRLPPKIREEIVKTSLPPSLTTTTTIPTSLPQTSTETIIMQQNESTTPETSQSTTVDSFEVTTEKELPSSTDGTTETRRDTTTESLTNFAVMLGDQPFSAEETVEETPKNKENISQLQEKPFLIIVTNPTVTVRTEGTTSFLPLTEEEEEDIEEMPSSTEGPTEGTEANSKYTTESSPRTTDDSFSESRDVTETSMRPVVTFRPDCDPSGVKDGFDDCEPVETEVISDERVTNPSSVSLPPNSNLPLLEPSSQVRFPSESYVPVRKTQSFVRFPDIRDPHEDRPGFWWPSWQIRQHPGIRGWPESTDQRQYPSYSTSWSDSMAWRRRFSQRD